MTDTVRYQFTHQLVGESAYLDLTEARRLLAAMGVTGWEAYARSIEA